MNRTELTSDLNERIFLPSMSKSSSLASDSLEVTAFAKALLDWKEIKIWDHNIEEETIRGSRSSGTQLEIKNESRLYNAAPNPTNTEIVVQVMIDKADLSGNPVLAINDLSGRLHATYNLKQGNNFVDINTSALKAGIYFYSLKIGGKTKEVKKLSIIH